LIVSSKWGRSSGVVIKIFDKFEKNTPRVRAKANIYFKFRGFGGKKVPLFITDVDERDIDKSSLMIRAPC